MSNYEGFLTPYGAASVFRYSATQSKRSSAPLVLKETLLDEKTSLCQICVIINHSSHYVDFLQGKEPILYSLCHILSDIRDTKTLIYCVVGVNGSELATSQKLRHKKGRGEEKQEE